MDYISKYRGVKEKAGMHPNNDYWDIHNRAAKQYLKDLKYQVRMKNKAKIIELYDAVNFIDLDKTSADYTEKYNKAIDMANDVLYHY